MGRRVENPYSYGSRNNSLSYSSFAHRIPRFEYKSPAFAFTARIEGTKCGDYPFDRRGPRLEAVPVGNNCEGNYIQYSEDIQGDAWFDGGSPFGTNIIDHETIESTSTGQTALINQPFENISTVPVYYLEASFKRDESGNMDDPPNAFFGLDNSTANFGQFGIVFDLGTGEIIQLDGRGTFDDGRLMNYAVEDEGDGWWRAKISGYFLFDDPEPFLRFTPRMVKPSFTSGQIIKNTRFLFQKYSWDGNYIKTEDEQILPDEDCNKEKEPPKLSHSTAESIQSTSVNLRGNVFSMGEYDEVEVYFEWEKEVVGDPWLNTTETSKQTVSEAGVFSQTIESLEPETWYIYRQVIEYGDGKRYVGPDQAFQTSE